MNDNDKDVKIHLARQLGEELASAMIAGAVLAKEIKDQGGEITDEVAEEQQKLVQEALTRFGEKHADALSRLGGRNE